MDTFDNYISLGFNCYPKKYFRSVKKSKETHIFEWLGSSIWSICALLENNFANLTNKKYIVPMKIFEDGCEIVTNKLYYIRFLHDFDLEKDKNISDKKFKNFSDQYNRRIKRFNDILTDSKNSIFFIRLEQYHSSKSKNRIMYNEYLNKENITEEQGMKQISKLIRTKNNSLKFVILHILHGDKNLIFDKENNIISMYCDLDNIDWENCDQSIAKYINENLQQIDSYILTL